MSDKLRVDLADLTLNELEQVELLLGAPFDTVLGESKWRAMKAAVCVIRRRDQPDYTLDQAGKYRMTDIELVAPDPEASSDGTGAGPRPSLVSGG